MKFLLTLPALLALAWPAFATPIKATYNGLFSETATNSSQSSGAITITTTAKGTFTGKLQVNGARVSFKGAFDAAGKASVAVKVKTSNGLKLELHLDPSADLISGTVSDGHWTAQLSAQRAAFDGKGSVAPQAGIYTLVIPRKYGSSTLPGGDGYGTMTVTKAGRVNLAGTLADGTKISQSTGLSEDGQWAFYVPLYAGAGCGIGWFRLMHQPETDITGTLTWIKTSGSKTKFYPAGFTSETAVVGSAYHSPAKGSAILSFANGDVVFGSGNLEKLVIHHVQMDANNHVQDPSDKKFSLTLAANKGTFRGKMTPPGSTKAISFGGVVLQSAELGKGYFLGDTQSGFVHLQAMTSDVAKIQTLGSSFAPVVEFAGVTPEAFSWLWSDGSSSSNYSAAFKDFGTPGAREQSLSVYPAGILAGINFGFDGSDGATNAPILYQTNQEVGAVSFPAPLTGLRYWASSYNPLTNTLDFTGFLSLEDLECFHCTNLQHVAIANLPSLTRICFESCDLQELDITGDPHLADVRAAINGPNAFTEVKIGSGTGPKIWHFCVRDNPQITQDFQTIMTNFYSLKEPWFWNANQSGTLKFVSTNLTDVEVQQNGYTSVDLSGQSNLQFFWGWDNQLTNLTVSGCVNLLELKAKNNQLPASVLDNLLAFLDTSCPHLQVVDLSNNLFPPSPAGCTHAANLMNKGITVFVDCP